MSLKKLETITVIGNISERQLNDIEALLRVNNIVVTRAFLATVLDTCKLYFGKGNDAFTVSELNMMLASNQRKYPEVKVK